MLQRIYLDYAASAPVDKNILKITEDTLANKFGNPSSLHSFGQEAQIVLDKARTASAECLNSKFDEVYFTGSATEANNWVVFGVLRSFLKSNNKKPHFICSPIEHESILEPLKYLSDNRCIDLDILKCGKEGFIDVNAVVSAVKENTVLISIIYVNNEIGTEQNIKEIGKLIKEKRGQNNYPLFHTDAVQAAQFYDTDVNNLNVDLMTLSSHKLYGPKGAGILFVKKYSPIAPLLFGGGQEYGLRSGTENIASIIGMSEALKAAEEKKESETKRLRELKNYFIESIMDLDENIKINGSRDKSSPHIVNLYFPQIKAEEMMILLDQVGVAVSVGSACLSRSTKTSYVIKALGYEDRDRYSIRFSFGSRTNKEEIDFVVKKIKSIIKV